MKWPPGEWQRLDGPEWLAVGSVATKAARAVPDRVVAIEMAPGQDAQAGAAVSFAVMQAAGCGHVLAFDQDFAAAGFTLWR